VNDDAVAAVARAVAGELVPRYGPRLAADTEAAIRADGKHKPPGQYLDPVAVGALIVAIAQLGYQIYSDHKSNGQEPTRETIAQAIRIERRRHSDLTGDYVEIIDIISAKIIERNGGELVGLRRNRS